LKPVLEKLEVLSLYGIGEPLTCPHLFDIAAEVPATCHTQFTSNGWLLNDEHRDRILRHRIAQVDFSLDASTPETYRRIRHGDLEKILENIAQLIAERDRRRAIYPNVILNMCLMRENLDDLPQFVRIAKSTGANHCYAVHLNSGLSWRTGWFDYSQQHCALEPDRHDARMAEAFALSHELQMPFEVRGRTFFAETRARPTAIRPHLPTPSSPGFSPAPAGIPCGLPWNSAIVHRDGQVTNCCWQKGYLGSLEESSFEEIWNNGRQRAIRSDLGKGKFPPACQGKSLCPPRGRT
jgi:MoaA/NifB/PqqE/SkfB family radical SAM enzyme